MQVTKAVVPVAGLGTRLLPTTKAVPKEMLPVGRYPIIHHVVEELIGAGIRQILFVTSRAKSAIENHFDDYSELILHLEMGGHEMREVSRFDYRQRGVEFYYTRQQVPFGQTKPLGTGDAVASAESFADGQSFVVAYGDSMISSREQPALLARMVASHAAHDSSCTIAVQEVSQEQVHQYGIVVPVPGETTAIDCQLADLIEKPAPERTPSRLASSARYVFSPSVFAQIRCITPSPSGELYLTDAILRLIRQGAMVRAVRLGASEQRHDIGNHRAYFRTFVDYALEDPELGEGLRSYLRSKLDSSRAGG
jgi:UTP--glucose-1-phosphate uridylyltransferase